MVVVVIRGIEYARSLTGTERETRRVRTFEGRSSSESLSSSSSSSSAFPLRRTNLSAKPERKGAKEGGGAVHRTISNVNTYLIVAFRSKPRSFLPRDDSRDRSRGGEGEGRGRDKGKKRWKREGRGREKENERERESVIQGYTKYISAAKNFETIELLLLSPPSFSSLPWYANRRRFTYSENRKSSDHASSLPRLSLFIIDAVVDIVSSVSS